MYERSQVIERRLTRMLQLIQRGGHSKAALAKALGVSIPTVSRDLRALRDREHSIRSVNDDGSWKYELAHRMSARKKRRGQ